MSAALEGAGVNPPRVVKTDLGDELLLLNVATRGTYTLNATGRCIWRAYQVGGLEAAVTDLEAQFEVGAAQARSDALALLSDLWAQGLLSQPSEQ